MNSYETWLKSVLPQNKEYKEMQCMFLIERKCSIYDERPNCCRQFPRIKGYYCSCGDCGVLKGHISNNTIESSQACFRCKDLCCNHILVPANTEISKEFFRKWMDITCDLCKKYFQT